MSVLLVVVVEFAIVRDIVTKIVSTTEFIIVNLVAVTGNHALKQMFGENGPNGLNALPAVNWGENSEAEFVTVVLAWPVMIKLLPRSVPSSHKFSLAKRFLVRRTVHQVQG